MKAIYVIEQHRPIWKFWAKPVYAVEYYYHFGVNMRREHSETNMDLNELIIDLVRKFPEATIEIYLNSGNKRTLKGFRDRS